MDLNIDTAAIRRVAIEAGRAGLPFIEQALSAALVGIAGPFGMLVSPALNLLFPQINTMLGLAADTPPDQTADRIASDPAAAQTALDTLNAQQQFALATQKQADDTAITSQAQQTALIAVDQTSESWFARNWRPTAAWVCVVGLFNDVLMIPMAQWFAAFWHIAVPPPPDATTLIGLLTALLGLGALRQVNNNSKDSVKKAIVTAPKAAVRR